MEPERHAAPDLWIDQIFSAKSVTKGGVVRRSVALVEREVGRDRLVREVANRGFHVLECGGQFVIVCSSNPIRLVV